MLTTIGPTGTPTPGPCPDDLSFDNVIARRNVLAGLWAGRLMGLSELDISRYAVEVHRSDYAVTGDSDVVDKIAGDLNDRGLPIPARVVREKLGGFHRDALTQTAATD